MRKVLFLTAALTLSAAFAFGALGDIVASFPAPANYPIALAVPNNYTNYLWVYCNNSPYRVYRVSGTTGSIFSFFYPLYGDKTRGLTYSYGGGGGLPAGSYLWMGNYQNDNIYRCRYTDGLPYAVIPAYHDMYGGLAVRATGDGGRTPALMLSSDDNPATVYRQSLTSGSIYNAFYPSAGLYDLAWDWRNGIVWTGCFSNKVYGYTESGSLVTSFELPVSYPIGFAYTTNYLWVSTTSGSQRIWQIHCPEFTDNTNVVPASVGKIKATFR